jgi:transketolase
MAHRSVFFGTMPTILIAQRDPICSTAVQGVPMTSPSLPYELTDPELDRQVINTIKTLAIDAVQRAASGHPGMPMGASDLAYVLWTRFLKHDPGDPEWPNRDRFVLSAGHGSMLLYALLHLSGYDLSLEDLKAFRQWGSRTPGHPEHGMTPGVEATTGPLGQGFANGVGMALAERLMAERFNAADRVLVDHFTYVLASDGDLMEGVAAEAASLAGHLRLGRLICLHDDNRITIEGSTDLTFSEDVAGRFAAYGWHVQRIDGHDVEEITVAIETARAETQRPSLIIGRTHIAHGSPNKQDTAASHGAPLGAEEVRLTKLNLGWPEEVEFHVPEPVRAFFAERRREWEVVRREWGERCEMYRRREPELIAAFEREMRGELADGWDGALPVFAVGDALATRAASGKTLAALADRVPNLIGGSADLAPSNNTRLGDYEDIAPGRFGGRNLHFGVREHAMGAIINGLALHGGFHPYGGTFLVFSDYMRPAIRVAALTRLPVIYVFTHDSVFVGEDGPTHQPVEQLASLRAIPELTVIRPADAAETVEAWRVALGGVGGPVALVLSRQKLAVLERAHGSAAALARGAYVIGDYGTAADHAGDALPELLLIGSGSEVGLLVGAAEVLAGRGHRVRVVSMPSWELFESQDETYRRQVLPPAVRARVAVEAATTLGWQRYVGDGGLVIGIDRFGASAPHAEIAKQLGFTVERVVEAASTLL